jgi:hypothetical protein
MSDAFDRWMQWRRKPRGDRRSIPAHLYSAVMSLPELDRSDRHKVNEAVLRRNEARREGRAVWLYLNDHENAKSRTFGDPDWIKVFASPDAADRWLAQHDPEGVAWEHEVVGGRAQRSVWVCSPDPASRAIGDPAWIKLFASKESAQEWVEISDPNRRIFEYPVQE